MVEKQQIILATFANGILKHFKSCNVSGRYVLLDNGVKIVLELSGQRITTSVPYVVISNAMKDIEAFRVMRFELILELTKGLRNASKVSSQEKQNKDVRNKLYRKQKK